MQVLFVTAVFCIVFVDIHRIFRLFSGDLWGPLVLCIIMATILHGTGGSSGNDGGPEFAQVFVIVWIGAMIVTLNSKLLGGNM